MKDPARRGAIEEEVADVLFFLLRFAQMNDIDLHKALQNKMKINQLKYPVDKARSRNEKSTEL